jgi:acylphosphatase
MRKATVRISGVVQGGGFRPFLVRLAREYGVTGFVKNECGHVFVEAYAPENTLLCFLQAIRERAPTASRILRQEQEIHNFPNAEERPADFRILLSDFHCGGIVTPSPDIATCDDCLRELFSPDNPRYRNPFISCTNCGPRYSILHSIPYDRANTSMDIYPMCPLCEEEYHTPSNRRFHAQTVCCNDCGPILEYFDREGNARGERALTAAIRALRGGHIVAVKGIGGYHFACDPYNDEAVTALRALKGRERKPFAVMFRDMEDIWAHCLISPEEETLLASPARPIVLLLRTLDSLSPLYTEKSVLGFPAYSLCRPARFREGPSCMSSANLTSLHYYGNGQSGGFSAHNGLYGFCAHRGILPGGYSIAMVFAQHHIFEGRGVCTPAIPFLLTVTELIAWALRKKARCVCLKAGSWNPPAIGGFDSMERCAVTQDHQGFAAYMRIARVAVCDMPDTNPTGMQTHVSPYKGQHLTRHRVRHGGHGLSGSVSAWRSTVRVR